METSFKTIKELLPKKLLKKNFTIYREQNLFGPDWAMLEKLRCPFCFNRLSFMKNKINYICRGKKHKRTFVISKEKLNEVVEKHKNTLIPQR